MSQPVIIQTLRTGVPGLDEVLGGGVPELSFNLIAGGPGCGKTTLAHQIMFASATPERRALYITILGEPPIKMLRYQQQFEFFDIRKLTSAIRFLHLGDELLAGGLKRVYERIVAEVAATSPQLVFVDSFRGGDRSHQPTNSNALQDFVQLLSLHLTSCEATTFLIGEYEELESNQNPIFTVADSLLWLTQERSRNSMVRQAKVVKMRGQAPLPGLHTMRISSAGVMVYPRVVEADAPLADADAGGDVRRGFGNAELDAMMGGGIPPGYSLLVVGPSGSGKTILGSAFVAAGLEVNEPGVIAVFEQRPTGFLKRTPHGPALEAGIAAGRMQLLDLRPLDLSVDETMEKIADAVEAVGAKRVVIDSLSGFELALAPAFREDFREAAYRKVAALVRRGVSIVMTAEINDSYTELRLAPHGISFLTDGIILQRFVELDGQLRRMLTVSKLRGFEHSHDLRMYHIDETGVVVDERPVGYTGVLAGAAHPQRPPNQSVATREEP